MLDANLFPGERLPYLVGVFGPCLSFGPDFRVAFDPSSLIFGGARGTGDLVILDNQMCVICSGVDGTWGLNLKSGEIVKSPQGPGTKNWSIVLEFGRNDHGEHGLVTVFQHSSSSKAQ
jgi:hypothetical protein